MIGQVIITIDAEKDRAHINMLVDGVPVDDVNLLTDAVNALHEAQDQISGKTRGVMKPYSVVFK